ncbi:unnamed protein product [Symbiodinium natans]|uniref:Reverse transcriptase domain-containing protein n=1 Tax=Symbiodinium natans TaxID=878477 RepID=A0A812TKZ8_9DINO|nr:unnamed protein product [Symbiodinium natans]
MIPAPGGSSLCCSKLCWMPPHDVARSMRGRQLHIHWIGCAAGRMALVRSFGIPAPNLAADLAVPSFQQDRRDMATALVRDGFDGKACATLLATGLAPETADTIAVRELHPTHPDPVLPGEHELPVAPEIVRDVVGRALSAFPAATAPSPSGLRAQHLRDACSPGASVGFLEQLAAAASLLAQGRACTDAAAVMAGAGLVVVPKTKDGVRPIAVGEILRRLTAKSLMSLVKEPARQHFFPAQLGVAFPAGVEVVVHTVRSWVARHSASDFKVMLKLDFRNACNTVSRQEVMVVIVADFPALARWVAWCYSRPRQPGVWGDGLCWRPARRPNRLLALAAACSSHPAARSGAPGRPLDLAKFY